MEAAYRTLTTCDMRWMLGTMQRSINRVGAQLLANITCTDAIAAQAGGAAADSRHVQDCHWQVTQTA